jgi:SAM-dependent methyltransferase
MFDPGRIVRPERLDSAEAAEMEANLRDIAWVNRYLGGRRVLLKALEGVVDPSARISILDVGAASGDMSRAVRRRYPNATVISLDHRMRHLRLARGPRVAADAFQPPFPAGSFDYVYCCHVLHHYAEDAIVVAIAAMRRLARRALVIVDLERHPVPRRFLPATQWLFRWTDLTVHDGTASVAAGFRREELARLARAAGIEAPEVRRHRPWFRLSLIDNPKKGD